MRRLLVFQFAAVFAGDDCVRAIGPLDSARGRRLLRLCRQLHESDADHDVGGEGHLCVAVRLEDRRADADRPGRRNRQSRACVGVTRTAAFLYAANWEDGTPGDHVSAFAIDHRTGKLTLLNKVSAKGDRANQVVLDPSGKLAATVTYNSGTFSVFGVEPDGKLTEAFYTDQHTGKPLSEKQPGPKRARDRLFEG